MRFSAAVASALYSSALLAGHVFAQEDVDADAAATSSAPEKAVFTVSLSHNLHLSVISSIYLPLESRQLFKLLSSNNSPTIGKQDGLLHMPKRSTPSLTKIGNMSESGLLRSLQCSRA